MTKRPEKVAAVRQALLGAAIGLLKTGGVPAASTRGIALAASTSTGAIFSHYGSHGKLLDDAMSQDLAAGQFEIDRLTAEIARIQEIMPKRKRVAV